MNKHAKNSGFTIVEMTVVVIVIAILAGVAIFGYGSWRSNMAKNQMMSDLNNVKSAMENARNFNNQYPTSIPTSIVASDGVTLTYESGSATAYCVEASSSNVSTIYFVSSSDSTSPKAGTC